MTTATNTITDLHKLNQQLRHQFRKLQNINLPVEQRELRQKKVDAILLAIQHLNKNDGKKISTSASPSSEESESSASTPIPIVLPTVTPRADAKQTQLEFERLMQLFTEIGTDLLVVRPAMDKVRESITRLRKQLRDELDRYKKWYSTVDDDKQLTWAQLARDTDEKREWLERTQMEFDDLAVHLSNRLASTRSHLRRMEERMVRLDQVFGRLDSDVRLMRRWHVQCAMFVTDFVMRIGGAVNVVCYSLFTWTPFTNTNTNTQTQQTTELDEQYD